MKKLILVFVLIAGNFAYAHEQDELNEAQQELLMLQQELAAGFERMTLLQNTILKNDAEPAQKCVYVAELKTLIVQMGYMIDQFQSVQTPASENMFGDDSAQLRIMFAEQMRGRLVISDSVIPTYSANNNCN